MKLKAYTDGSYSTRKRDRVGAAYILLDADTGVEINRGSSFSTSPWLVEMRNVGGEILAAQMAIEDAQCRRDVESVEVLHDYKGVGAWPDGEWEARKPQTKIYRDFIRDIRNEMPISFTWVQGHSGNEFNDIVDGLAKGAL